uniref:molybdenum cofactor biosynthesis protein MoaE n=1 Tax=Castellaniella defragrans TaxID=75697 RepID=UPI00334295DD
MVVVQTADFDPAALYAELQARSSGQAGAMVSFIGTVRDYAPGEATRSLFLEHYPGMCEREIQALCDTAAQRWSILDTTVVHRVGELALGERIVFVGVASAHRGDAFRACEYIIDALKTRAPFWKRETTDSGRSFWVQQDEADARKTDQWDTRTPNNES